MKLPVIAMLFTLAGGSVPVHSAGNSGVEHFRFTLPNPKGYWIQTVPAGNANTGVNIEWIKGEPDNGSTNVVEFGSRVVLQLRPGKDLQRVLAQHPLAVARVVLPGVYILQAPNALSAVREANRMAAMDAVSAAYPVLREQAELHGTYASLPSDYFFSEEWALENRNNDGSRAGLDLNVRAAWPYSMGQGVTIAVADTGVELAHPELAARTAGAPHFNFADQNTNAGPVNDSSDAAHGTEVAGLAAASINNARMTGVAPAAGLASWVIFHTNSTLASDEDLMDLYQYQSNIVSVQNHSWGHPGRSLSPVPLLQQIGISNAVTYGRSGRGVVIVRSAGNSRASLVGADDDGYPSDPQVIAVGAVRRDGRIATYTQPGACVLVGAPSGDFDAGFEGLFTTDLTGTRGMNQINFFPPYEDMNNYVFNSLGFSGTSASAPQISGVAALMVSANPNLTYRDVQQIMLLASRHFDFADPDLTTNGAGFAVNHSIGFGVPDAGIAVALARQWTNRPAATIVTATLNNPAAIPDEGLKLVLSGQGVPDLGPLHILPSSGLHVETLTPSLRLADFGYGTNAVGYNLTNQAALIQRDASPFTPKLNLAAQVGAAFAVVYNYSTNTVSNPPGGDALVVMATDFGPIPAVFLGHNDGEALKGVFQTNASARIQIRLQSTNYQFTITNTLLCEHVGLRVQTDHQRRGDLRITLVSPSGTRSVLQHYSFDSAPGPVDWTYYSTHHFFESSAGTWMAYVSDEGAGYTGMVQSVTLQIQGVAITDSDGDGLDDIWEMANFGSLAQGPKDDPDQDGYNNAREQLLGTDPTSPNNIPFGADLSLWNTNLFRLSWSSSPGRDYQVWSGTDPQNLQPVGNLHSTFPETEWFGRYDLESHRFYRVELLPSGGTP